MGYIVGHPIKHPRDFYGRSREVYRFYEIVAGTQAQSLSILGLRRAGKTSFLRYVANPDVMARHLPHPDRYTMLYLDVSTCRTPADFYGRILRQLQRAVGNLPQTNLWKPSPAGSGSLYDLEAALCHFPDRRFVLLLDEFDQLKSGQFDVDFLSELRSLTSVWEYELACVTASYWDLYQLGAHIGLPPTSPFYNIFYPTPIYLNGLHPHDASLLVRMPVQQEDVHYSEAEAEQLLRLSGSLPFFVQATAATFWRKKREHESLDSEQVQHQLVVELSSYFMQWWRQMSDLERELLRTVAKGEPLQQLTYSRLEVRESVRRLLNYGVLQEDGDAYRINGQLFATWLRHYAGRVMFVSGARNGRHAAPTAPQPDRAQLFQQIKSHFIVSELQTLCFELDVDPENLRTTRKDDMIQDLIGACERNGRLPDLVALCESHRPHVAW